MRQKKVSSFCVKDYKPLLVLPLSILLEHLATEKTNHPWLVYKKEQGLMLQKVFW